MLQSNNKRVNQSFNFKCYRETKSHIIHKLIRYFIRNATTELYIFIVIGYL